MTPDNPVSVIHLTDRKSHLADITTWPDSSGEPQTQWRGELRFHTAEPESSIGFSIYTYGVSQTRVLDDLMNQYKSNSSYLEEHFVGALTKFGRYVEARESNASMGPTPLPHTIRLVTNVNGSSIALLDYGSGEHHAVIQCFGASEQEAKQRADECYVAIVDYVNRVFAHRLARLAEYLVAELPESFSIWKPA